MKEIPKRQCQKQTGNLEKHLRQLENNEKVDFSELQIFKELKTKDSLKHP